MDIHQVINIVTNTCRGSGPTTNYERTRSTFTEGINRISAFQASPHSTETTFAFPTSSQERAIQPAPSLNTGQLPQVPGREAFNLDPGLFNRRIAEASNTGPGSTPFSQGPISHPKTVNIPGPPTPLQFHVPRLPQGHPLRNQLPPVTYQLAHTDDRTDFLSSPHPIVYNSPPEEPSIPAWCDNLAVQGYSAMLRNQHTPHNERIADPGLHQHTNTINPRPGVERPPATRPATKNPRNVVPPTASKKRLADDTHTGLDQVTDGPVIKKPHLSIPTQQQITMPSAQGNPEADAERQQTPPSTTSTIKLEAEPSNNNNNDDMWAFLANPHAGDDDDGWFD
ncbi:MAG: hypothetical protein Q9182_004380 [Xanthomendoza sp. 2 TL-2023]